jgi:hypothetical protein
VTNSGPDADPKQAKVNIDVDPKVAAAIPAWATQVAVETALSAVQVAIRTAALTSDEVPNWAGMVTGLLEDWSQQLDQGGRAAGQAGTARTPGMLDAPSRKGVRVGSDVLAAPLPAQPLLTWLRLRWGVRRCLACGRLGQGSLEPASPLVLLARARTWRCVNRDGCRQRRIRREGRR